MSEGMRGRNCIAFATLTVSNAAGGITLASATPAISVKVKRAVITVETDQVRWRADGTAPSSTEGHLVNNGDTLQFMDANYESILRAISFIRVTADAKLKITYFD